MWGSDRGLEISKQFLVFLLCILPLIDTWLIICWLIKIIKTAKQKSAELYGDDKNDKLLISSCQLWSRGAEAATTRNFFDWEEKFWKSFRSVTRRYRHIPLPDQLGAEQDWDLCYHLLTKCDKQTHFKWYHDIRIMFWTVWSPSRYDPMLNKQHYFTIHVCSVSELWSCHLCKMEN